MIYKISGYRYCISEKMISWDWDAERKFRKSKFFIMQTLINCASAYEESASFINTFFQFFADFKKRQFFGSHLDPFPGHGIPALIGFIFFDKKRT
jgi:hypothetical protein